MVEYYLVFCTTVAIVSLFKHFLPNINTMLSNEIINEVSRSRVLSSIVYFCIVFIFAPLLFFTTIIPSVSTTFKEKMYETLIEKE